MRAIVRQIHVHQILVMPSHHGNSEHACVDQMPDPCPIRISGHVGPTALSAFPPMVSQLAGSDTQLTGVLDRFAVYGVLAEIETPGLDLIELRGALMMDLRQSNFAVTP